MVKAGDHVLNQRTIWRKRIVGNPNDGDETRVWISRDCNQTYYFVETNYLQSWTRAFIANREIVEILTWSDRREAELGFLQVMKFSSQ